jgi:hypothetical protein
MLVTNANLSFMNMILPLIDIHYILAELIPITSRISHILLQRAPLFSEL